MADDTRAKLSVLGVLGALMTLVSGVNDDGSNYGGVRVRGTVDTTGADGSNAALGATTDAEAAGNGSIIAVLKRLRTLVGTVITQLAGGLPAALTSAGNLKAGVQELKGAANLANGQGVAGAAAAQLVAARATRRSVTVRNTDAANSCYVGAGAITTATGFLLKAGESISLDTTAAVNCLRATADVTLCYVETYD